MATEIEFFNKELTLVDFDGGSYIVCAECNERRRMHEDSKRNVSHHARSKTFFWQQDNWGFDDTKWLQTSRKVHHSPRREQRIPILSAIWVHSFNFSLLSAGQQRCVLAYRSAAKIRQHWRRLTIMFQRRFQMAVKGNLLIAPILLVIGLRISRQFF